MTSKANKVKRLVLLDVHAILHRAYHALPEFSTSKGEPTGGLYGLSTMLLKIIDDLKPDYLIACYDLPKPTYRHEAYEGYKAGRAKADDELVSQIKRSYDIFRDLNIPIYHLEGFEADDMIGTIVHEMKGNKDLDIVIASGDMDTLQLVEGDRVRVYTLKKGIKDTIIYNEDMVKERFGFGPKLLPDYKGLRGDPSDNIIGISGIGEKTASTLIQNFGSLEDIYKKLEKDKKAFKDVGITDRIVGLLEAGKEDSA
ncbi:MAG: 5'-3' exonuclease H3TH domain-containing protein, partial [bacterium]